MKPKLSDKTYYIIKLAIFLNFRPLFLKIEATKWPKSFAKNLDMTSGQKLFNFDENNIIMNKILGKSFLSFN